MGHTFASLAIRDYRLLWLGQVNTSLGLWMDQVTRSWLIYQLTGSALGLGLATALRGLPLLFFGIIAGAVADRSGRKAQLIIAQTTNAVLNALLATLVVIHRLQPWHIYITGFLAGTVQAFQQPARQTLISDIVGDEHLLNALALNSMALNSARTIGPALAGMLIAFLGPHGSYYTQAGIYLLATLWTVQMVVPERQDEMKRSNREPFFRSIKTGLAFVVQDREIRTLMILAHGPLTLGMPYVSLLPIFAIDILHGGARLQGLLLTCVGLGSVIGALGVAASRRPYGYGGTVVAGGVAFGIMLFGFAASRGVILSALCALGIGLCLVIYQTQNQTLLQIMAPRHLRGRVMSVYLLNRGLVPLGTLLAGALAEHLGGPAALQIMSVLTLAVIGIAMLIHPQFLTFRAEFRQETTVSRVDSPPADNSQQEKAPP
jgi:MFS family permease